MHRLRLLVILDLEETSRRGLKDFSSVRSGEERNDTRRDVSEPLFINIAQRVHNTQPGELAENEKQEHRFSRRVNRHSGKP